MPDTGKLMVYRSSGGFGVRLDAGNGFQGAVVTPYYDSLLVKISTWGMTFAEAAAKMDRNLREFRIRGVKTNIPFLGNVVVHKNFIIMDNSIRASSIQHLNYLNSQKEKTVGQNY